MILRVAALFWLLVLAAGCGSESRGPMKGLVAGEEGRVTRITDGDTLALSTGLSVRLANIEAPSGGYRERPEMPGHTASKRALETLALGRTVRLYYPGMTRDRYDRALAHVVVIDTGGPPVWLNMEMVKAGQAWGRFYADTDAGYDAILAAERPAREAGLGLWSLPRYRAGKAASEVEARSFVFLAGVFERSKEASGTPCRLTLTDAALPVVSDRVPSINCDTPRKMTVRGWYNGDVLFVSHPGHMEVRG